MLSHYFFTKKHLLYLPDCFAGRLTPCEMGGGPSHKGKQRIGEGGVGTYYF